jgi:hypothetical protein
MKKNILFPWAGALLGAVLCFVLFGFSATTGAHNVQVYLDNKLMIDQYIDHKAVAAKLDLDRAENHDQLIVKYSECGRTVTGRKITIKDSDNKVLKEWEFKGSSAGFQEPMPCPIKDILALKPKKDNALKLYYSSDDFPEGQQFAYLVLSGTPSTASR